MDQIIPIINWIKKNVFWIVCFFLTAAVVTTWIMATIDLDEQTASNQRTVDSKVSAVKGVQNVNAVAVPDESKAHPNKTTVEGMQSEINDAVEDLVKAWETRYKSQASVRVWPKTILESDKFKENFVPYDPPETFPTDITGLRMKPLLRLYAKRIPGAMDRLVKKIQTKWEFAESDALSKLEGPKESDMEDEEENQLPSATIGGEFDANKIVVQWNEENQNLWLKKLTQFEGRDDNRLGENLPSPLQVFMLQQDLWLLEASFDIIAKVNSLPLKDADGNPLLDDNGKPKFKMVNANDLAVIKRIDHIAFGREAQAQLGKLTRPDLSKGLGQTATNVKKTNSKRDEGGPPKPTRSNARPGGNPNELVGGLAPDPKRSPFHGRYVSTDFEPLPAETVREVLSSTELPKDNLELVIARRIPVRIALRMDERHIGRFIDACNESSFAFEIEQIRINRHTPMDGIELAGTGGFSDENEEEDLADKQSAGIGELDDGSEAGDSDNTGDSGAEPIAPPEQRSSYVADVEFYGIVKLYNPVRSREFLTGEKPDNKANAATSPKKQAGSSRP